MKPMFLSAALKRAFPPARLLIQFLTFEFFSCIKIVFLITCNSDGWSSIFLVLGVRFVPGNFSLFVLILVVSPSLILYVVASDRLVAVAGYFVASSCGYYKFPLDFSD